VLSLLSALLTLAGESDNVIMPAYTHLQRAQPTLCPLHEAYAYMFRRDVLRLEDCLERMDECPLGTAP
jgi:argininosuccinate lyase